MTTSSLRQDKVVVIGGGTGVFTVLTGLKKHFGNLTAVVAMSDNGGSTGVLREEFGILPPGDVRRALVALAHTDNKILSDLFSYRFEEGGLKGHSFGNLMITALERLTGSFERALEEAGKILDVRGRILPVTTQSGHLHAQLEDGQVIVGENNIDIPSHDPNLRVDHIWLQPKVEVNPHARNAILEADLVIVGPGDLYTSIIPNLLVGGITEALKQTSAQVVYIVNVMTKKGETGGFKASDFLRTIRDYLGEATIDTVILNSNLPTNGRLKAYLKSGSEPVNNDLDEARDRVQVVATNLIREDGFIRHNPDKLAETIVSLIN